jgi:transposase-like protein
VPTYQGVKCPTCRTRQLVVIELQVAGEPISLHRCSHCDRRWWQGIDGSLSLAGVLTLASGK